jgi:hypothetical protein
MPGASRSPDRRPLIAFKRLFGHDRERDAASADATAVFVCRVLLDNGTTADYLTLLPPDVTLEKGLPGEAVIGALAQPLQPGHLQPGQRISPSAFRKNPVFVDFLHGFIEEHLPNDPLFIAEARRVGDGWVAVIDQRTPTPGGHVPPEDILGVVEVRSGEVVRGSYRRSEKHVLLSHKGFFQLGKDMNAALRRALVTRAGAI